MEGTVTGVPVSEANAALWQGRRQTGGALIVAGAACWLVHSVLMIIGFVVIFSISLSSLEAAARSVLVSLLTFVGATIAVLFATFLIGVGLVLYRTGTLGLSWVDPYSGEGHQVSPGTRTKGLAAAVFILLYGILGIAVIAIYAALLSNTSDIQAALNGLTSILILWIVASILLIVGAALLSAFLHSLRTETASAEAIGGGGVLAYAISNAVGVFLLAGSLLAVFSNPLSAPLGLIVPIVVGGVMELLAVPIVGIVIFSLLIPMGLRLRKLQAGRRVAPGYYAPAPTPPYPYAAPVVSQTYPAPGPAVGSAIAARVAAPSWPGAGYPPPPPSVEAPPANLASAPAAPPPPPPEGESWVLRLQAQVDSLERAVKQQKEFLFEVERGLLEGRIDNATYADIVRNRTSRIAELEREIAETKGKISGKPVGEVGPAPTAEPSKEPEDL